MAVSLADAIKEKYQAELTMIEGSGGVFDVHLNGTQIWCKLDVGRFPKHEEILKKIESLTSAS